MKTCSRCSSPNADDARFCSSCGNSFPMTCPSCGAEIDDNDRFCSSCGAALGPAIDPGEERKLVTVLFSDLEGSTALGERLDPERLKEIMTAYFREMRAEIEAEGGTVEKFIGDAVMAVFGVPIAHEDDAARAVRAAIHMHRSLDALNQELGRQHGVRLVMRIGINTGEAFTARAPVPGESMVAGDVVNVAARLQQGAPAGAVLVSERTASAARGFQWQRLQSATLRGRAAPVETYLLAGEASASERGIPGMSAPMIGRDHELAFLQSVLERAIADGRPHLVTVYGDPGVGKSRLVAEFIDRARSAAPGLRSLIGRCLPYGEGVTYWPFAEILKSHCGILDSDPPELALEKIDKVARDLLTAGGSDDPHRITSTLAYTMGLADPHLDLRSLTPRQVGVEIRNAWGAFFTALATDQPIVVLVEDIHWGEDELLDLIEELARSVSGRVLFLCPARGELSVRRPTWGGGQRNFAALMLDPLPPEDATRLIESLLSAGRISSDLERRVLQAAEGNPFFLEEIIRKFIDEGTLVRTATGWTAQSRASRMTIPDTVQATLAARIDLLPPEDKRVLQQAAVVGRIFWTGALVSLMGMPADAVEQSLDRLAERELVRPRLSSSLAGEHEYIFKHILTRDVAYESLPHRDRSKTHRSVASWIEQTAGERRDEVVELVAHHYVAAYRGALQQPSQRGPELEELRKTAIAAVFAASEDARERLALHKAVRLAHDALSMASTPLERSRAYEAAGDAHYINFHGDSAWRAFCTAVDERLSAEPVDGRAIAMLCAKAVEIPMRWQGIMTELPTPEEVERYMNLGLEYVDEGDSIERVRLLTQIATRPFGFFYLSDAEKRIEESIAAGEEAIAIAARIGDATLESSALDGLDACYVAQGMNRRVLELCLRRIELAPRIEDPLEVGDIYAMAATAHLNVGNFRESRDLAEKGFELTVADAPTGGLHCLTFATMARFELGDWDGALERLAKTIQIMGDREMPPMAWMRAWGAVAFIHDARGNAAEADRLIELLDRVKGPQTGRPGSGAASVAMIYARRERYELGRAWLERLRWPEADAIRGKIECDFIGESQEWALADEIVGAARKHAEVSGCHVIAVHADRLEGRTARARGDLERAEQLLSRAAEAFSQIEASWEEAVTRMDLAEVMAAGGRDDWRRHASAALEVFERVGSLREQRRAHELLGAD